MFASLKLFRFLEVITMAEKKGMLTRAVPWLTGLGTAVIAFVIGLAIKPPGAGVVAILVVVGLVLLGLGIWLSRRK